MVSSSTLYSQMWFLWRRWSFVCKNAWVICSCADRAGGGAAEVSPVLVRVCTQVPGLDVLPQMAEAEGLGEVHGERSVPGSGHHYLHRSQHALHGSGALSHDRRVQPHAVCGEPGEHILLCFAIFSNIDILKYIYCSKRGLKVRNC